MALDVHILNSATELPRTWPLLQITEEAHIALFSGGSKIAARCPILRRMWDYYADVHFTGAELQGLIGELNSLLSTLSPKTSEYPLLSQLLEICRRAEREGKVVVCFAD
jgi:hypothetical protein